jgi:peroxidase
MTRVLIMNAQLPRRLPRVGLSTGLILLTLTLAFAASADFDSASPAEEFRTFDGTGNNLTHLDWGAAGAHLLRQASGAHYSDGIASMGGAGQASPRAISNAIFDQRHLIYNSVGHSDYIWTWGQFLDHDLSLTPGANESVPIPVPPGDPFFDPKFTGTGIIPFHRSVYDFATGSTSPREQINLVTGYIDGSMVYGSDGNRASWLRAHIGGQLKVSHRPEGDLLAYNDGTVINAGPPEVPDFSTALFVAGDIRVNEQPTLACMHTLFVREHNYQAARIAAQDSRLSDEEVFQRARRIVIAEIQAITYEEFIPALLGPGALRPDRGYDPAVNAGIAQVFSTAAYRLGHTLLSTQIPRLDEHGNSLPGGPLILRDIFFNPTPPLLEKDGIEPILRGIATHMAQDLDNHIIDDVRNFLFGPPGAGGLDLVSLNIQRGRDHGLPDFNTVRVDFGLPRKTSFLQITSDPALAEELADIYGAVDNIDVFAGLLVEDRLPGMIVGETLRAILIDQFERSRAGDRFFYTRSLSGEELARVRTTRLSDIIRRNTSIRDLQNDVFFVPRRGRN